MIVKGKLNTELTNAKQLVYNVSAGKSFRQAFIRKAKDGIIVEQYKVKDFDSPVLGELVSSKLFKKDEDIRKLLDIEV